MSDTTARLLEAERVLHSLEIQIEQYRIHLEELVGQPYETEKANAVLRNMATEVELQRKYCGVLVSTGG